MVTKDITNIVSLVPIDLYPGEDCIEFFVDEECQLGGRTTITDLFGGKLSVKVIEDLGDFLQVGYQCRDSHGLVGRQKGKYLVWTVPKIQVTFIDIKSSI